MSVTLLSYSIISLVFTTLLLGFVLAVIIVSYRRILDNLYKLRTKEVEMKENINKEADKIIEEARNKALQMISQATAISQAQQSEFKTQLSSISQLQAKHYDEALETIKNSTLVVVDKISSDIKTNIMTDFSTMLTALQTEVNSAKTTLRDSMAERYQKDLDEAKVELEEYKNKAISHIDETAKETLKDFMTKVVGKVLSLEDHQDLIMKALEEAKQKNVF